MVSGYFAFETGSQISVLNHPKQTLNTKTKNTTTSLDEAKQQLLDSLPVKMAFLDPDFNTGYLNHSLRNFLGIETLEGLVGNPFKKLISEEQQAVFQKFLNAVKQGKDLPGNSFPLMTSGAGVKNLTIEIKKENTKEQKGYWCVFQEEKGQLIPGIDFRSMVEHSRNIVMLSDDLYTITYVSPSCESILEHDQTAMTGKKITDFCHPDDLSHFVNDIQKIWNEEVTGCNLEVRFKAKDGSFQWFETLCYPIVNGNHISAIQYSARKIEPKKVQELKVRASELKYRRLIDNMDLGYLEVNSLGEVTFVNESFCRMTRYSASELRGVNPEIFLLPDMENRTEMNVRNHQRLDGMAEVYQMHIKRKDGVIRTLLISAAPLTDQLGNVMGSAGIHWDITPLLEMEVRLYEKEVQRQRNILQVSIRTEERQKQTLGRELHDGLGQLLAYISLNMQLLLDRNLNSQEIVENTRNLLNNAIAEVRQLSRTLIPVALDSTKSLLDIITESLKHYANMKGLKFEVESYPVELDLKLSTDQKHVIFRILQELTNNTIKYAEATTVSVNIAIGTKNCTVDYRDNGKGFNMRKVKKGVGFESIQTRIDSYQGKIAVHSKPGNGVHVYFSLPFTKKTLPIDSLD